MAGRAQTAQGGGGHRQHKGGLVPLRCLACSMGVGFQDVGALVRVRVRARIRIRVRVRVRVRVRGEGITSYDFTLHFL